MHNFLVHSMESACRERWRLGLDQVINTARKIQKTTRIKGDKNKGINTEFSSNVLDYYSDDNEELPLVDM